MRSFEALYPDSLWHLDYRVCSRTVLTRSGQRATPRLLGVIDDYSRLICHLLFYLDETAESLVHGLSQALQKRTLPRAVMSDNGSAMKSAEFTSGLMALGIQHELTQIYSPEHYVLKSFMCYSLMKSLTLKISAKRVAHKWFPHRLLRKSISVFRSFHGTTDRCSSATEHAASARAFVSRSISA